MNEIEIRDRLLRAGNLIFDAPRALVPFTGDQEADELINNLDKHPHAFVLACVMDRQIRAELAWLIPHRLREQLGDFSFSRLRRLSLEQIQTLMTKPNKLHRFPAVMSKNLHAAIQLIDERYAGNAAAIWGDQPSSAAVVYRFLQFRGVGSKIATMATNILARSFKIPFSDYFSIDISVDVHIRHVFTRLGLIPPKSTVEALTYAARGLHPTFPGLLDLPVWQIGRNWCKQGRPLCNECYMKDVCPTALGRTIQRDA